MGRIRLISTGLAHACAVTEHVRKGYSAHFHVVCHSPAGWFRLVYSWWMQSCKREKMLQSLLRQNLETVHCHFCCLLLFGSQGQPRFKGWGHRLHLLMEISATLEGPNLVINLFYVSVTWNFEVSVY